MYPELREERIHGTKEFPFSCYHLHDMPAFFQIPVHWHPEVEIIYVRSGSLNVIIEGGRIRSGRRLRILCESR